LSFSDVRRASGTLMARSARPSGYSNARDTYASQVAYQSMRLPEHMCGETETDTSKRTNAARGGLAHKDV
jgi:hypothetical protein